MVEYKTIDSNAITEFSAVSVIKHSMRLRKVEQEKESQPHNPLRECTNIVPEIARVIVAKVPLATVELAFRSFLLFAFPLFYRALVVHGAFS